jgi:hypothetical protein
VKTTNEFDCVQMKTEIQDRLLREIAEVGEEEAGKRREERLLSDPILGRFVRSKRATQKDPAWCKTDFDIGLGQALLGRLPARQLDIVLRASAKAGPVAHIKGLN